MYFCPSFIKMSSLNIFPFSKGDIILKSFILGPLNVCIIVNVDVKAMDPETGAGMVRDQGIKAPASKQMAGELIDLNASKKWTKKG